MKLREKIKLCVDNDQVEKIANDFAIGFAEWLVYQSTIHHTIKQLLEIYKKEKGL